MRKQLFDIAVCDDVQTDREETAQLTEEICKAEGIVPRIVRFERAEALLEAIQGGEHFALLLIDVLLPGLEEMLPEHDFIRCHQSFLVNWHHAVEIQPDEGLTDSGRGGSRNGIVQNVCHQAAQLGIGER